MKKTILLVLLPLGMLLGPVNLSAQTSAAALKELEVQVERLANTTLPDFAPEPFKSVQTKIRELRAIYEKEGRVPPKLLAEALHDLENFQIKANRTRKVMNESYGWRNAAIQYNFARSFDPASTYRAEQSYREALTLAGEQKFEEARRRARQAKRQYQTLIRDAHSRTKKTQRGVLKAYEKGVKSDISALSSSPGSLSGARKIDAVMQRMQPLDRPRFGLNVNGNIKPPYIPPKPPPDGPIPPVDIWVSERTANSLRISWADLSSDEDGNRLIRSTNFTNWSTIFETGPIPRMTNSSFNDTNLSPAANYCYAVETFNIFGAQRSPMICPNTRDLNNIPIWRLQLRVKVANFSGAGLDDAPLRVYLGGNSERPVVDTILDYGQEDFERNEDFTYDLNFGHIKELNDITNLLLSNRSTDLLYIEEITFLVNQQEVFHRHFGLTPGSALRIGDSYRVDHDELRGHQSWQQFVNTSKVLPLFSLQPLMEDLQGGKRQLVIPAEHIVSRTESLVGHMLNADEEIRDKLRWGFINGPAVEISKVNDKTLHFDLDLEVKADDAPNPSLDLDFDIEVDSQCNNAERKLNVSLTSKNFTSNIDFTWWKDLLSLGVLPLSSTLINWYANERTTPPQFKQSFGVNLPENFNCNEVGIEVNDEAGVNICCF